MRWNAMKNRERYISQRNEYDLLREIQATMLSNNCCVIEALVNIKCQHDKECMLDTCCECIQKWLNEDERTITSREE